jgi:recombination protein RecT
MTAVETQPRTAVVLTQPVGTAQVLRRLIGEKWKTMQAMLPTHMTQERFAALVVSAAAKDSNIFSCTGESILNVIYQAASLGLEINAATGEAYIVPYKNVATLVPGYKGLVKLAIQSREVSAIEARLVYEGEEKTFGVYYGTDSRIEHVPNFTVERTPGKVIFAYAVAKMPRGGVTFEVMTRTQLEAIRHRAASSKREKSPWNTDTEEMYRKTATRRLVKYLPMSPQLAQAVELSDKAEADNDGGSDERFVRTGATSELNAALGTTPRAATARVISPEEEAEAERQAKMDAGE